MKTQKITVLAENGLHARPVGDIVRAVKSYAETTVTLATPAKTVSGASMLGVLSLGLKAGTEVEITANGPQEDQALAAIVRIIETAE
ncbi:MAG: HPr family phosphocarrier protein [Bacteroidales bacterium]|jgi:phosphotransferase system HPr (HPr) family protein|nr:HPr family phosphocarrier protein [Bacteroidales bacterium]MBR6932696.1 HPr family phosphocarrier protein [Bacteroidales bacterium]